MTDGQPASVHDVFEEIADRYETVGVDFFVPIARLLLDAVGPRPGERALDIGCGRGAALVDLARRVAPGGSAVGIDISERMAAHARAAAAAAGVDVDVRVDDGSAPSLDAGSFDLVVSSLVIFFLPDPAAALRSWLDLLRPGGRLGITTFDDISPGWKRVHDVFAPYLQGSPQARSQEAAGEAFKTVASTEELVRSAGFADVHTTVAAVEVRFSAPEQWEAWCRSTAQVVWWHTVPAADLDRVRADAYAAVSSCRDASGRIGFDQGIRTTLGYRPQ